MNKETVKKNVCTIKGCGRPTHKESKYCIFHAKADEKTADDFKKELKEYVDKIKEEDGDYDFKEFIFIGDINFKKDLSISTFVKANFDGATFERNAFCNGITFERDASFDGATFKRYANFNEATFKGYADFRNVTFKGYPDFGNATFKKDSSFILKHGEYSLFFSEIKIFPGKKLSIEIINEGGKISFDRAYLENTDLDIELVKDTLIDFTGALLKNTTIKKGQIKNHILQEKEKKFSEAQETYLLLKNNFHSIGRYRDESWAFTKEKDMERKSNYHFKTLHKWLWSCFLNAIYGYGEKPERVFLLAISIILIFACVFMNYGITSPPLENLPKYNIMKELSMGILYGDLLIKYKAIPWEEVKNVYILVQLLLLH